MTRTQKQDKVMQNSSRTHKFEAIERFENCSKPGIFELNSCLKTCNLLVDTLIVNEQCS